MTLRCGKIAIIGRPNVGKSTLINCITRNHLSITSPRPQTTRVSIKTVVTEDDTQLIFIDNPGFNLHRTLLDRKMRRFIVDSIISADIIVGMTELTGKQIRAIEDSVSDLKIHKVDRALMDEIVRDGKDPNIIIINKIDRIKNRRMLLPLMDIYRAAYGVEKIFPLSAKRSEGVEDFLEEVKSLVPEGEFQFDPEVLSDRPERFFVAEFIREQIFRCTRLEVPYATSVSMEDWNESEKLIRMEAIIHVEKKGQKAIIVGKKGAMIKNIGTQSRKVIEDFLGKHVYLGLRVSVKPDWRENVRSIDGMIEGE